MNMHCFAPTHKMLCEAGEKQNPPHDLSDRQGPAPDGQDYSGGMSKCISLQWLLDRATEQTLTPQQIAVMAMLLALQEGGRARVTKTQLGALVGLSERQVSNVLRELESELLGFITSKRMGRAGNAYDVRPDSIGNPLPETHFRLEPNRQWIAGNPFPVINRNQQPIADQSEVVSTKAVDNHARSVIQHAPARAETPIIINTSTTKLYPETVEGVITTTTDVVVLPPAKVLNGAAAGMPSHELAAVLVEHANSPFLDPTRYAGLVTSQGRIRAWISAGADFDADILPTIKRVMASRREAVQTWSYFDKPVRRAVEDRLTAEQPMAPMIASQQEGSHEQRTSPTVGYDLRRPKISASTAILMRQMRGD